MPRRLPWIDLGTFLDAAAGLPLARGALAGPFRGDDQTARAIAFAGLAALFGLPFLMIASVVLKAPLAVPAAIALGYLAMSYALASQHVRGAGTINALLLAALVLWSLGFVLTAEALTRVELVAALLAPAFAAAPAMMRFVLAAKPDAAAGAALSSAACLDRLAPEEAVLVARRDGTLLAATRAAHAELRLPNDAIGRDVARWFGIADRPKLANAVARCAEGEGGVELSLLCDERGAGGARSRTAEVRSGEGGVVSIRLRGGSKEVPGIVAKVEREVRAAPQAARAESISVSGVSEGVAFALRNKMACAEAIGAELSVDVEAGLRIACERQFARRIPMLMLESALKRCQAGESVVLTARSVKSVALLRLVHSAGEGGTTGAAREDGHGEMIALRSAVEGAGGTLVVEETEGETRLSVRLDLAPGEVTTRNDAEAG